MPVHSRLKTLLEFSVEAAIFLKGRLDGKMPRNATFSLGIDVCEAAVRESNDIHAGLDGKANGFFGVFFHIVIAHWVPLVSAFCYW